MFAIISKTESLRPILKVITLFKFTWDIWTSESIPSESEGLVSETLTNSDVIELEYNDYEKYKLLIDTLGQE